MSEKQRRYCGNIFKGEGDICNDCKLQGKEDIEKKTKFVATVETYALLRNMNSDGNNKR